MGLRAHPFPLSCISRTPHCIPLGFILDTLSQYLFRSSLDIAYRLTSKPGSCRMCCISSFASILRCLTMEKASIYELSCSQTPAQLEALPDPSIKVAQTGMEALAKDIYTYIAKSRKCIVGTWRSTRYVLVSISGIHSQAAALANFCLEYDHIPWISLTVSRFGMKVW